VTALQMLVVIAAGALVCVTLLVAVKVAEWRRNRDLPRARARRTAPVTLSLFGWRRRRR
jgi:hypothetical protein